MAMLQKNKSLDVNSLNFNDYFNIYGLYSYEKILIINDDELNEVLIKESINDPFIIEDTYPIYTLLKLLNNSSSIYLKSSSDILYQDEVKDFIKNYSKTIIVNIELISYLKELDLVTEEYSINKNEYIIVNKYQNIVKKSLK